MTPHPQQQKKQQQISLGTQYLLHKTFMHKTILREEENEKKKKLAQQKEYRKKIYQRAKQGMGISERALFYNMGQQITDLRQLIKTQRRKTVCKLCWPFKQQQ